MTGEAAPERLAPRHFGFIDALRGFAFLGVLVHHTAPRVTGLSPKFTNLALQGFEGVQLFFLMSAFTLFLSLDSRSKVERRPITGFFIRRFFRIAPLFYAGVAFYYFWDSMVLGGVGPAKSNAACFLSTLTFTNCWNVNWINRMVPGGWSIAVEMNFYLMVPALFMLLRTKRLAAIAAFVALIGAIVANFAAKAILPRVVLPESAVSISNFTWYWLPTQMPIFCLGFLLFFIVRPILNEREEPSRPRTIDAWCMLGFAVYLMLSTSVSQTSLYLGHVLFGFAFLLVAWSLSLYSNPLLVNPVTRYIGTVSFSAYITHFAVLDLMLDATRRLQPGLYSSLPPTVRFVLLLTAVLAGTVLFATITYRLIEVPGQRLGRRIIRRMESSGPVMAVTVPGVSSRG